METLREFIESKIKYHLIKAKEFRNIASTYGAYTEKRAYNQALQIEHEDMAEIFKSTLDEYDALNIKEDNK